MEEMNIGDEDVDENGFYAAMNSLREFIQKNVSLEDTFFWITPARVTPFTVSANHRTALPDFLPL